jgi:hypothetical protein
MRRALWLVPVGLLLLGGALWLGSRPAGAQGGAVPGSAADPLVTESYVQSAIQAALAHFVPSSPLPPSFAVVDVPAGDRLLLGAGAEVVLRSGRATALAGAGGGLADLTAGRDLVSGAAVAPDHLLLCPRADGRGVLAETALILLVEGGYQLNAAGAGGS